MKIELKPATIQTVNNIKMFKCDMFDAEHRRQLRNAHRRLLVYGSAQNLGVEVGMAFDLNMNPLTKVIAGDETESFVSVPNQDVPYIVMHTHPANSILSGADLRQFAKQDNLVKAVIWLNRKSKQNFGNMSKTNFHLIRLILEKSLAEMLQMAFNDKHL